MVESDYERNLRIMHKNKQINDEQIRQIAIHKWIESEKAGRDLKEAAEIDWVKRYASAFRLWVDTVPSNCIECGLCGDCKGIKYCKYIFNEERLKMLDSIKKSKRR